MNRDHEVRLFELSVRAAAEKTVPIVDALQAAGITREPTTALALIMLSLDCFYDGPPPQQEYKDLCGWLWEINREAEEAMARRAETGSPGPDSPEPAPADTRPEPPD